MHLTRLIYFSERNPDADTDIEALLEKARRNNERNRITGALWFNGETFIQILEGSRTAISRLYNRISRDSRHNNVELVTCQPITERHFGDWSMAYCGDLKRNRNQILRYSTSDELDPSQQSADSIIAMLSTVEPSKAS